MALAILKPAVEQMALETVKHDTVVADEIKNIAMISPTYPSQIIDDTSEMTIYSTNAPFAEFALLSFVNNTKPKKATEDALYPILKTVAA